MNDKLKIDLSPLKDEEIMLLCNKAAEYYFNNYWLKWLSDYYDSYDIGDIIKKEVYSRYYVKSIEQFKREKSCFINELSQCFAWQEYSKLSLYNEVLGQELFSIAQDLKP